MKVMERGDEGVERGEESDGEERGEMKVKDGGYG